MAGGAPDDHREHVDMELRIAVLEAKMNEVQKWKEQAIGAWYLAKFSAVLSAGVWALLMWAKEHIKP